jgi:uncharacterized protein (TIGR00255 family)
MNTPANIFSMTGFGSAELSSSTCTLTLQLKSVNSRYLDLILKVPDELAPFEGTFRELINHRIKRGKIECKLTWQAKVNDSNKAEGLNNEALQNLLTLQQTILVHAPNAAPLSVNQLLNHPSVLPSSAGAAQALSSVQPSEIETLVNLALDAFIANRANEGAHLTKTLSERLDAITQIVKDLRQQLPELLTHQKTRLTERLLKAMDASKNDVTIATSAIPREELIERIKQEVSLTAIRIDVSEELDRLDGHIKNTRNILSKGDSNGVGKKLDFLMQEFNREANTLGSKSASLVQTEASMTLKLIIEQMREQVQNIE